MSETDPRFPQEKRDRRKRNRSRPNTSDRRIATRYYSDFPVTIYGSAGGKEIVVKGLARDVSDGGMFIHLQDGGVRNLGSDVRIAFTVPNATMPEEYIHGKLEVNAKIIESSDERNTIRVSFKETISERLSRRVWRYLRAGAVFAFVIAVVLIIFTKFQNFYFFWFDIPVFLYSICVGSYLISRFIFAFFYRTPKSQDLPLPTVTLVIPVYNEEDLIKRTLTYALEVAYPKDKIEFIAVNDGSKDGSLGAIEEFRKDYPELVVINLEKNHGKRYALAAGARIAKGDIIVFMDSDSFLKPDAIEKLMQGFADPKVAAVSGHCEVENQWSNFLTKMQTVRYYVGFRIMKGAESIFDAVTCLSGPLSAYRKEIVMEFVDDWVNQKFLGRPATFGDDRSLTNFILKKHKVIYDSRAITTTFVPENYSQFFRQQARWKRSWFRESLRAAMFMWKKQPLMSVSFYLGFLLPILGPAVVLRAMIYMPIFHSVTPLNYMAGIVLMSCLMCSAYLFAKKSRLWLYGIPFCFFYMFLLIWQLPWAMATFWESDWGTRG